MQTSCESNIAGCASDTQQDWLRNSVWWAPELEITKVKSWTFITAVNYRRGDGETVWRSDRHRIVLTVDRLSPLLIQVEQGHTRQMPSAAPGTLAFFPADTEVRYAHPAARFHQVLWDTELYSALLPEFSVAGSQFEFLYAPEDPLLCQIVTSLAHELEDGFADRILGESLGTALCIRIAQRFIGSFPLPVSQGLSPERLQRVRDYIEAHLDDDLSLTVLADVACLSPYHFSRSFKRAIGVGPHRYVIRRRLQLAKRLLRQTDQPLARIARQAGFVDQSHLASAFRRELGVTPRRLRAAKA